MKPQWKKDLERVREAGGCFLRKRGIRPKWHMVGLEGDLTLVTTPGGTRMWQSLNRESVRALLRHLDEEGLTYDDGEYGLIHGDFTDRRLLEPYLMLRERNSWEGESYLHFVPRRMAEVCEHLERLAAIVGDYEGRLRVGGPSGFSVRGDVPGAFAIHVDRLSAGYGGIHDTADLPRLRVANSVEKACEVLWKGNWASA